MMIVYFVIRIFVLMLLLLNPIVIAAIMVAFVRNLVLHSICKKKSPPVHRSENGT